MVDKIWYNMEELIGGSEERVLIETYWNVNRGTKDQIKKAAEVLIETYWNVNAYQEIKDAGVELVLIETYWNVNLEMEKTKL